jgi:hypothetical protein
VVEARRVAERRVITLAERRELLLRRAELAALVEHTSWDVLQAVVEDQIDQIKKTIVAAAMNDAGISVERQAYLRGLIQGMRAVRSIPRNAHRKELMDMTSKEEASG